MKMNVGVVDYGMGNLHSVAKALSLQNVNVLVSRNKNVLKGTDLLVVPGVGSFGAAMTTLAKNKLDDWIVRRIAEGKPYLGICLGFQLLFERSEESPGVRGLSVFRGSVKRLAMKPIRKIKGQIPHMGWNTVQRVSQESQRLFRGIPKEESFYFVHSFIPEPRDSSIVATQTQYGDVFCSSVADNYLFACQFHPEKSGQAGMKLLKNIIQRVREGGSRC